MKQPMSSATSAAMWRLLAVTLCGVVVTGLSAWVAFAKNVVTDEDLKYALETREALYLATVARIDLSIAQAAKAMEEVKQEIKEQRRLLDELVGTLRQHTEKDKG